jgi:hypothetical protein
METEIFNNRLIAEFMGYNVIRYNGTENLIYNGNKYAKTVGELKNLWGGLNMEFTGRFVDRVKYPYDTDFNFLIPIIRRIEEAGFVVHIAGIKYQVYHLLEENNPIVSLVCGDISKKTKMVFDLIVDFIKWHNGNHLEN